MSSLQYEERLVIWKAKENTEKSYFTRTRFAASTKKVARRCLLITVAHDPYRHDPEETAAHQTTKPLYKSGLEDDFTQNRYQISMKPLDNPLHPLLHVVFT